MFLKYKLQAGSDLKTTLLGSVVFKSFEGFALIG